MFNAISNAVAPAFRAAVPVVGSVAMQGAKIVGTVFVAQAASLTGAAVVLATGTVVHNKWTARQGHKRFVRNRLAELDQAQRDFIQNEMSYLQRRRFLKAFIKGASAYDAYIAAMGDEALEGLPA